MAMIKCAECKKRVSDTAPQCPKCGATPDAMLKKQKTNWVNILLFGGFLAIVTVAAVNTPNTRGVGGDEQFVQVESGDADHFRSISVRSDTRARYWITSEMAAPTDPIALISTKRVGPSGESHNMRIYNCDSSEVAYIRDEQDSYEALMASPNYKFDELQWGPLIRGSIAWEIAIHACRVRLAGT